MSKKRGPSAKDRAEEVKWLRHLCGEAGRIIGWNVCGPGLDRTVRLLCWGADGRWRKVKKELEKPE